MGYASFFKRTLAILIDGTIISLISIPVLMFTLKASGPGRDFSFIYVWILIIITWLYYGLMESSNRQASLGKILMSIKVTDRQGNKLSFGQASKRFFARILSALPYGLGFLWALWGKDKQTFHDKIAQTYVVTQATDASYFKGHEPDPQQLAVSRKMDLLAELEHKGILSPSDFENARRQLNH